MSSRIGRPSVVAAFALTWTLATSICVRADVLDYRSKDGAQTVEGNVIDYDPRFAVLFEGRDTRRYFIEASNVERVSRSEKPISLFSPRELRSHLENELGDEFRFFDNRHYLICYTCTAEYAREAGALLERAYRVFTNYFRRKGKFPFKEPRQRMIVLIYRSREEYVSAMTDTLGALASQTSGVYVPLHNRMYMYDAFGRGGNEYLNVRKQRSNALMLRHNNVSTVIHEAIHQVAFNVGFHNRGAPLPLWLVEGMAMFFESPDLDSRGGWKGVGEINHERVATLQRSGPNASNSLRRLVINDEIFRDPRTMQVGYAEAWALTYFLAKTKKNEYAKYLKSVNARPPTKPYTPEDRLADFRDAFGADPSGLESDYQRYLTRVVFPKSDPR